MGHDKKGEALWMQLELKREEQKRKRLEKEKQRNRKFMKTQHLNKKKFLSWVRSEKFKQDQPFDAISTFDNRKLIPRKQVLPIDIEHMENYISSNNLHFMFHNDTKILKQLNPTEEEKLEYEQYLGRLDKRDKPTSYIKFILSKRKANREKGKGL